MLEGAHKELQSRVARHLEEERLVAQAASERWEAEKRKEEAEHELRGAQEKIQLQDEEKAELQKEIQALKN